VEERTRGQEEVDMSRSRIRVAQAIGLAAGAPLGWLALRRLRGAPPAEELKEHPGLYSYLLTGTALAFSFFGYHIGKREERLLATNRRLDALSITDALTGLHNVRYFRERLREEHAGLERGEGPLALVLFDIDHFKQVNDRHGHPAGDRVLAMIGDVFSSYARHRETAARVGGEEFALLLPGRTVREACQAAERIRRAAAERTVFIEPRGPTLRVTLSAGVAGRDPGPDHTEESLYADADRALYKAKERGRDRVEVAHPSQ
jgi:diguanylate cyclase (GGDEF)-like protein